MTCFIISRFMPSGQTAGKHAVFVMGAYLAGFLAPLLEALRTLKHVYLAIVLPNFMEKAGVLLVNPAAFDFHGIFPYENVGLGIVGLGVPLAATAIAMLAFVAGTQRAYRITNRTAWVASTIGLGLALGCAEAVSSVATTILAASGLV